MSDQVVFTKEEVEKIKDALRSDRLWCDIYTDIISILDSPRHRPKVSLEIVYGLLNLPHADTVEALENAAIRYLNLTGFDVED